MSKMLVTPLVQPSWKESVQYHKTNKNFSLHRSLVSGYSAIYSATLGIIILNVFVYLEWDRRLIVNEVRARAHGKGLGRGWTHSKMFINPHKNLLTQNSSQKKSMGDSIDCGAYFKWCRIVGIMPVHCRTSPSLPC